MSEHLRLSSPASSSPGRLPAVARPDWPWVTRSYSQRSLQNSPHPIQGSSLQSGWDPRTTYSSTSSQSGYAGTPQGRNNATPRPFAMGFPPGESTRQWTFTVFLFPDHYPQAYISETTPRFSLTGLWMGNSRHTQTPRLCRRSRLRTSWRRSTSSFSRIGRLWGLKAIASSWRP